MYEGGHVNSGYRIKKRKNNYLAGEEQHNENEDDQFKISIHSSSQYSPNKNRRLSQGIKYRNTRLNRSTFRYKRSSKNLENSSITTATNKTKMKPPQKIRQFDNVKWLSIISAYDPKQLKNVTTTASSYQKFLKTGDVRKDPYSKDTYRVVIEHFKSWVVRIRDGYFQILNRFLAQNTNVSAIVTLAGVKPLLEQVKFEASMMHEKVKCCQQTKNYRQFSGLLLKFDSFLQASQQIEQIIYIVNQSKNNIDDLFKNLERDNQIDKKVDKERRKGIKKARKAVKDYGDDGIEGKILQKVQNAINQMANKTLQAFSKINGARGLMLRIKQCLADRRQFYDLQKIIVINEIFREVLREADEFQKFSEKFMQDGDILNDDLKQCILKYKEQVYMKRQAVEEMQLKFISDIIQSSIQILQANYSVCNANDSVFCDEYRRIQKLLDSICEVITDQNKKALVDLMLKDNKDKIRKLQHLKNKIAKFSNTIAIDQGDGLDKLLGLEEIVKSFKSLIRTIVQRQQRTFRQLNTNSMSRNKRGRWQQFPQNDPEEDYLKLLIKLSKKMNLVEKKNQIQRLSALQTTSDLSQRSFKDICQHDLAQNKIKVITWCSNVYEEYDQLVGNNELGTIINIIYIEEQLYESSTKILQIYKITLNTQESTLLAQSQKLSKLSSSSLKTNISINFLQRCIYYLLYLGLQKRMIKSLQNPEESIVFPSTQHDIESLKRDIKYFNMIIQKLPSRKNLQMGTNQFEQFSCNKRVQSLIQALKEIIEGVLVYQNIKWNNSELYYIGNEAIFESIMKCFSQIFLNNCKEVNYVTIDQSLYLISNKLTLCLDNLDKLQQKQNSSKAHKARIHHITTIIGNYKQINKRLLNQIQEIQTSRDKLIDQAGLKLYSEIVVSFSKYLHDTKQSCHIILNNQKNKCPIYISAQKQAKDQNILGKAMGLPSLKIGDATKKCQNNSCIPYNKKVQQIINTQKKNKQKEKKQKKRKNNDIIEDQMEEYIENDEDSMQEDDMGEEIDDDVGEDIDDDMGQQIDDMEDIDDDMGQQIDQQKIENQHINNEIADQQFDFEDEVQQKHKKPTNSDKKKVQIVKESQKPVKQQKKATKQIKQQEQYQSVKITPKSYQISYELFTCPIDTLEQLLILVSKLNCLEKVYWEQIDYKDVEQYYNRQYKGQQIKKLLLSKLDAISSKQFPKQIYSHATNSALNSLESYKKIIKSIHNIDFYKIQELIYVIGLAGRKFSKLVGTQNQLLWISIQNTQGQQQLKWQPNNCIIKFLTKQLKQLQLWQDNQQNQFEFDEFMEQLTRNKEGIETRYRIPKQWQLLQPKIQEHNLKHIINQIKRCSNQYVSFHNYPDGVDLPNSILQLWVNAICAEGDENIQQIKIKQKIYKDMNLLKQILNKHNFLHYIPSLRIQSQDKYKKISKHQKCISQIFQGNNDQNIIENVNRLIQIYQPSPDYIITLEDNKHPLILNNIKTTDGLKKLLLTVLKPIKKDSNIIISSDIQQNIRDHVEQYLNYSKHVKKLLSVLSIQSHIWASQTNLQIYGSREEIMNVMVKQASFNTITNTEALKKQANKILHSSYKVQNCQEMVWQYTCKNNTILDSEVNSHYMKQLQQLRNKYKKYVKINDDIGICIIQSILEIQSNQSAKTQTVLEQLDELESILSKHLPDITKKPSIFSYFQPYLHEIVQIQQQVSNLKKKLEIIVEPVDFSAVNSPKFIEDFRNRSEVIAQLYEQFSEQKNCSLGGVDICFCKDNQCSIQNCVRIYIAPHEGNKNLVIELLALLFSQPSQIHSFIKTYIDIQEEPEDKRYQKIQTLHGGRLLNYLKNILQQDMGEQLKMFMSQYNYKHFIDPKNKQAEQSYKKLKQKQEKQYKVITFAGQILSKTDKNNQLHQLIRTYFAVDDIDDANKKAQSKKEQLQLLTSISMDNNRKYADFAKWVLEVVNKIHKINIILLMDKIQTNNMICIFSDTGDEQQLKTQLQRLKLPSEYILQEKKNSYQKIQLKSQNIYFKLSDEISQEQLRYYQQQHYGLNDNIEDESSRMVLIMGIYEHYPLLENSYDLQKDELLLQIYEINENLSQNNQLELTLNQDQLHGELQFRIIQTELPNYDKQFEQNAEKSKKQLPLHQIQRFFKKIIKSQKINKVYIGDQVQLPIISKQLKQKIEQLKNQRVKQAQLLEQKQRQQQQRLQKLKEEEQAKAKRQKQQKIKKEEQEEQDRIKKQRQRQQIIKKQKQQKAKREEEELLNNEEQINQDLNNVDD